MADGIGCTCAAWSANECCCGVDWTPKELTELRERCAFYERTNAEQAAQLAALRLKCDEAISACASETCAMAKKVAAYKKDAERYRWLRETFHSAVGAGIEVNDDALVYQDCEPGEEVRVYWYPNTPVGFNEATGSTIDVAIDAAMHSPEDEIERARRMV